MQMIFTYFKLIMHNQIQMHSPKHPKLPIN